MLPQIDEKAVTVFEAQRVYDTTLDFCREGGDPFGVVTLLVPPEDFHGQTGSEIEENFLQKKRRFLDGNGITSTDELCESTADFISCLKVSAEGDKRNLTKCLAGYETNKEHGLQYYNIILLNPADHSIYSIMNCTISNNTAYPGDRPQYLYRNLWHEIAHGLSFFDFKEQAYRVVGEPQADMISAVMCRKAFTDNTFLKVVADRRYMDALTFYESSQYLEQYGIATGELIDEVLTWPAEFIDWLSENGIKALRLHDSSQFIKEVQKIGFRISDRVQFDKPGKDRFNAVANVSQDLLSKGAFGARGSVEYKIASRFALAARRLSIGEKAYTRPDVSGSGPSMHL